MTFANRISIAAISLSLCFTPLHAQLKKDAKVVTEVADAKKPMDDLKPIGGGGPVGGPGAPVDPKTYKLGAEDVVFIRVWKEPDLSGMVMVRPDGKISMPLIGELPAVGLTPEQLTKNITEALNQWLNRPEVFLSVQQVNSKKFYVTGEVNKPGTFALVTPTTVLEALSGSGGLREFANGKRIVIIRGTKRLKFNFKEVLEGKNLSQNIFLESGDQIYVP
ncbi:MAG: polysaccharide biosynthesis/export family protein [Candidatus Solibacter usitatus]|nr:polysaccharide biosynthesis/export family protein [Candidatus Solibacter usitatus]